jgi:hypothetical protein
MRGCREEEKREEKGEGTTTMGKKWSRRIK